MHEPRESCNFLIILTVLLQHLLTVLAQSSFHLLYLLLRAQVSTQILGLTQLDPWMSLLLADSHSSSSPLLSELDSVDYKKNLETGHKHNLK